MHTLAMFLGEEGLGMTVDESEATPFAADLPLKTDLLLNVLDMQSQIATLDQHVQTLVEALKATPTHH